MYPKNFESPIFVVGCARSYTSMIAGIINKCGAWGGTFVPPHQTNPRGFFENSDLRNGVTKPYLASIGADPQGQIPLPEESKIELLDLREKVFKVLTRQGYDGQVWFYKEPKLAPMWKTWFFSFPKAKWIIVRRDTEAICESVSKVDYMNKKLNTHEKREVWVKRHIECLDRIKINCQAYEIWPALAVKNFEQIEQMLDFLNLSFNERVNDFIDFHNF